MGTSNSTPVHPEMENIFWEEIATNGTKPVTDLPTNIYCKLAVLVGENTYLFGNSYTYDNTTYKVTYSPPQIHVFNITSRTWRKIEAAPPAKKFGADYYGTKIGTDIWVINDGTWYCFDTTKEEWRTDSISTPCGHIRAKSVAVNGDKIYIYNSDHQNIKHNIICLDTKEKKSTELPDAFGEHPEERQETYLYMIDDNTLGMFAPETSSDSYRGEFFYYDLTENKWARAKDLITKLGKDKNEFYGDNMTYVGRVDNILYFLGFRDGSKRRVDAVWCREICSEKWIKVKIGGETYFNHDMRNAVAVTDSTLYYFTNDSRVFSMKKSFMNEHVNDSSKMLSELARKELSAIKAPVVEIPEFNNDPIVLDAQLAAVKEKLDIHYRITEDVSELKLDELSFLEKTVPEPSPTILHHKNFLHYLTLAWSNHFSVVISPDIIFYTILCEIADQIKKNPEDYRTLFTDSMEKKQIITLTSDPEKLDLNAVIAGIAKNTPVDAEIFTASFSCSSLESRLAMNAAFCDAMSPYYDYANTCCGIPRIKVLGTKQDWQLLEQKVHRMRTEVFSHDLTTDKTLSKYLNGVEQQIRLIHTSRDPSFWKNMFSINRCGSGHTDQVKGWICLFYREFYSRRGKSGVQYLGKDFYNYESHISIVKWTNIDTDRKFKLETGLLYSNVVQSEDPLDKSYPWLEPQFAHYTQEDKSISMEEIKEMVKELEEQAEKK